MSQIKINITKVISDTSSLSSHCNNVTNIKEGINKLRHSIDGKILARRNIGTRLNSQYEALKALEKKIHDLEKFVDESMDRYEKTEKKVQKIGESLEILYAQGIGTGLNLDTSPNLYAAKTSEYAQLFHDNVVVSDEKQEKKVKGKKEKKKKTEVKKTKKKNDKEDKDENCFDKAMSIGSEGINAAKNGIVKIGGKAEDIGEKVVNTAQDLAKEAESAVAAKLSEFEGAIGNIESQIDKVVNNKDVKDLVLNTAEYIAVLGMEFKSSDPKTLKVLPKIQQEYEDNIKRAVNNLCKLYSKDNPNTAKAIINASNTISNGTKVGWEVYKKLNPEGAGLLNGGYKFVKGTVGGAIGLVHGAGVQYYDIREDPEGTLKIWGKDALNVLPYLCSNVPKTDDDIKFENGMVSSIKKDVNDNLIHGDAYTRTSFLTDSALNVATLFVGGGEVNAASKAGEAGNMASKAGEVVSITSKAEETINIASKAEKAEETVNIASKAGDISKVSGKINEADKTVEEVEVASNKASGLENKVVDKVVTKGAPAEIAIPKSEAVTHKVVSVLTESVVAKAAVKEASIEKSASIIEKAESDVSKVRTVEEEAELKTAVNGIDKAEAGVEGKSASEVEVESGKTEVVDKELSEATDEGGKSVNDVINKTLNQSSQASIDSMKSFNSTLEDVLSKYKLSIDDYKKLSSSSISELTDEKIKLMYNIRQEIPMPDNTTLLSKVITESTAENCCVNGNFSNSIVNCVARVQDTSGLKTYDDYFNTFGLDYRDSEYLNPNKEKLSVIRFNTDDIDNIKIPYGGTTDAELDRVSSILGIDKSELVKLESPFQGNGITKNAGGGLGSPEYTVSVAEPVYIKDGAAIYDIDRNGNETLRTIYYNEQWHEIN
mgnify:CR=1 FL=1